jgi:hypothetical protein
VNTIIKRHYPTSRLPADLREGLPDDGTVLIKIVPDKEPARISIAKLVGTGRNVHGDEQSVIEHINSGRKDR